MPSIDIDADGKIITSDTPEERRARRDLFAAAALQGLCAGGSCRKFHGHAKHSSKRSAEHSIWTGMIGRCTNPKQSAYEYYGGRGIKVCGRWLYSFTNFIADMGRRPSPQHSIDRIDNDGHYEPGNCRWARRYSRPATLAGHCAWSWTARSCLVHRRQSVWEFRTQH